ncbi:MAG: transposase [Alphaproteobacteria bacterium]
MDKNCYKQRGWGKIGKKLIGKITGKRIKRTNIIAGLCGKEVVAPMIFQGSCNAELFMAWVQEQLVPSLKKGQVIVMDNASFHKSPRIRTAIEQAGCRLIYLPPYSPDLNPIEIFWANMKKWIKYNIPNITNTWNAIVQFFDKSIST